MSHLFHVGDEDGVSKNKPIVDERVALGNDVDPLVFPVLMKAYLDYATIGRVAICDGQNFVVHQP